jgi:hypothetical protein
MRPDLRRRRDRQRLQVVHRPKKTGGWIVSILTSRVEGETHNREHHNSNSERGSHHLDATRPDYAKDLQVVPSRAPVFGNDA